MLAQRTIDIVPDQHHSLRKIPLQDGRKLVGQPGSLIDGIATSLSQ